MGYTTIAFLGLLNALGETGRRGVNNGEMEILCQTHMHVCRVGMI